jgi:alkylation response protein AidB-like acyl-CoA dehydrogenase
MGVAEVCEVTDAGLTSYPVLASTEEALVAVRGLLPAIAARSAQTDATGNVPPETIADLEAAGLFGVLTPRAFGGSALGWEAFFRVVNEIGTVCGSTAWVFGVLTGHNHMLTRFPVEVQQAILPDPKNHISVVFRLTDAWMATPVEGGYNVTGGIGRFCSGVDYARYVGINVIIDSGPNAGQMAFCMIDQHRIEKMDDWKVLGMRGTQSRSIVIENVFVEETRVSLAMDLAGPPVGPAATEGAFYAWPYFALAPFAIVGAPLGVARGMVELSAKGVKDKLAGLDDEIVAGKASVFGRLSHASLDIEMATDLILKDARRIDEGRFDEMGPLDHARFRRDLAAAPQQARSAANSLFESSGGSGIYDKNPLGRMMRDVNAGAAHYAFTDDLSAPNFGRALLGLPPAKTNTFV